MFNRGGGSAAAGLTEGSALAAGSSPGAPALLEEFRSTSCSGMTAAAAGATHSGVQHCILSWSGAIPDSAPGMEQSMEGAADAAPGVSASDRPIRIVRNIRITLLACRAVNLVSMTREESTLWHSDASAVG